MLGIKNKKLNEVMLSLGSNIGNRKMYLKSALIELRRLGEVSRLSSVYESEPWGKTDQASFLNQAVTLSTEIDDAEVMLEEVQRIEERLGRIRLEKWGARCIDIDILFFNREIISTKNLVVPHPLLSERLFVLRPLSEIHPSYVDPKSGLSVFELEEACKDPSVVRLN